MEVDEEVREDAGNKGKRVREKREDETVVKRKCVNPVAAEAFDISAKGKFLSVIRVVLPLTVSRGRGLSVRASNDIRVLPSFAVEVVGDGASPDSGWEFGSEGGPVAVSGLPVVPDVGGTTPFVVTVMCGGVPSDWVGFCGTAVLFFL